MTDSTHEVREIHEMERRGELKLHHIASARGYISRRSEGIVSPYKGKFGEGYTVRVSRYDTTRYINVFYYVKP